MISLTIYKRAISREGVIVSERYEPVGPVRDFNALQFGKSSNLDGQFRFNVPLNKYYKNLVALNRIVYISVVRESEPDMYNISHIESELMYQGVIKSLCIDVDSKMIQVSGVELASVLSGVPATYNQAALHNYLPHYGAMTSTSTGTDPINYKDLTGENVIDTVSTVIGRSKNLINSIFDKCPGVVKIESFGIPNISSNNPDTDSAKFADFPMDFSGVSVKDFIAKVREVFPSMYFRVVVQDMNPSGVGLRIWFGSTRDSITKIVSHDKRVLSKSYVYSNTSTENAWFTSSNKRYSTSTNIPFSYLSTENERRLGEFSDEGIILFKVGSSGIDRVDSSTEDYSNTSKNLYIEQCSSTVANDIREVSFCLSTEVTEYPSLDVGSVVNYVDSEYDINVDCVVDSWDIICNSGVMNIMYNFKEAKYGIV